jgi:predicted outer membrane repeat protein
MPLAQARKAAEAAADMEYRVSLYQSMMERRVANEQDLNDEMLLDYLRYAVLMVPGEDFTMAFHGGVIPYESFSFPKSILDELTRTELTGVPTYSIIMWIDPVTWETVIFDAANEKEVIRIQPDGNFNPMNLVTEVWGDSVLIGANSQEILASHSPSRMWMQYDLMDSKDISELVIRWSVTSKKRSSLLPASPVARSSSRSMKSSSSDFEITAITNTASGMELSIQLPTAWPSTNDVDIFGTDDLISHWWDLLATTNGSNTIAWTDSTSTNDSVITRYYNVGDGETDSDSDGYTDAREELMYHSDPDDEDSFPVTVSGSVVHTNTPQSGSLYVVAVTASNSWDLGRSTKLSSTGSYSVVGIPNQDSYYIKAWRDWHANGEVDDWEATGTSTNSPIYLTNSISNVVVTLTDPPVGIAGTLSYTGRQSGVCRTIAVATSNSWSTNSSDELATPGDFYISGLSQTDYWVKAWIDADSDGVFDTNSEASGTWPSNPIELSNSVWGVDFQLTDVDDDADGMPDWWEIKNFGNTNQSDSGDYDSDTMPNGWEYTWNFCPTNAADAMEDIDGDGYFNVYEYHHESNPWNSDAIPSIGGGGGGGAPDPTVTVVTNGGTTIQAALDQSTNDYDIVLVEAGTHSITNDIDFPTNIVLLIAEDGASATTIESDGNVRVIEFNDPVTSHTAINGFTITGGQAVKGGGIRLKEDASPTIVYCVVSNNTATEDGGGIWCDNASPDIRNCTFADNQAYDDGGGAYCQDGGTPKFTSCYFIDNLAKDNGGGMCFKDFSTGTVATCTIDGNTAYDHGGGIYCQTSSPSISGSLITDNTAVDGGGIGCKSSQASVVGCMISGNWAHVDGGGIRAKDSQPVLRSTVIARNKAFGHGGGVQAKGSLSVFTLENYTIADNESEQSGGGLSVTDSAAVTNSNCIIWGNLPQQLSGTVTSLYSCIQGGASGTGIVTNDPSLTPVYCSLRDGSSCTNVGTNAVWMTGAFDFDGEARIGDSIVDIGADELYDSDDDGMGDAWELLAFGSLDMDGTADSDGDELSDADEYAWDADPLDADTDDDGVGDGAEVAGGTSPTEADDPDLLTLTFCVGDPSGSGSETYEISFSNDFETVIEMNMVTGMVQTYEHAFLKGMIYTNRVDHGDTDGTSDCGTSPDYDYSARIEDLPVSTNEAWTSGPGFMIHDPDRILGTHYTADCTSDFAATNGSGYAILYVLLTDLDVDIDGDGNFDELGDDIAEDDAPGKLVCVNWDDDNTNSTADYLDSTYDTNENDLVAMRLDIGPASLDIGTVVLEITEGTNFISVWTNRFKGGSPLIGVGASSSTNWTVGSGGDITDLGDFPYTNLWVEGITNSSEAGDVEVVLSYESTNGLACSSDSVRFTVINPRLVPNYDRDDAIDSDDENRLATNETFHFWINNDDESSVDSGNDIPGDGSADSGNYSVDSVRDLIDFFPVWNDLKDTLSVLSTNDYDYLLKHESGAMKAFACNALPISSSPDLKPDSHLYSTNFGDAYGTFSVGQVTPSGLAMPPGFLNEILSNDRGIVYLEGCSTNTNPLVLEIRRKTDSMTLCEVEMPVSLSGVENMYRHINLRPSGGLDSSTNEPPNYPDSLCNSKNLFFLHGFNADGDDARGWHAEIFKRLYWSGSNARFWGVTWRGDEGSSINYQENVWNAFLTASNLAVEVGGVSGTNNVVAHSLGNMVVSSAIEDHGLSVSNYFMLNAAVATECYDPAQFSTNNYMAHDDWDGYHPRTWCSKWFELFSSPDDRAELSWQDRFPSAVAVGLNLYSSGDEVLEIYPGTPGPFSGGIWHLERYAWHKQETLKGRTLVGGIPVPGGTSWAGWGFSEEYTMAEANDATEANLRTNTVFRQEPSTMFSSNILTEAVNGILAQGVPALSYPAAVTNISLAGFYNFDAEDNQPNGWGRSGGTYDTRWLHNDLKNMAYLYTYSLFDRIVSEGALE